MATPPVDRVERWPLEKLRPYPGNPRRHSPAQIERIAGLMREYGQTQIVLIDGDPGPGYGEIIAGHGRLEAARLVGWADIAVGLAVGWSEAQKHAYRVADNAVADLATWDLPLLQAELAELQAADFDLSLAGFSEIELVPLFAHQRTDRADEPAPEPPKTPVSKKGDVWLLGEHRLLCGDSTEAADVAAVMAGASPRLMVTDPPMA